MAQFKHDMQEAFQKGAEAELGNTRSNSQTHRNQLDFLYVK